MNTIDYRRIADCLKNIGYRDFTDFQKRSFKTVGSKHGVILVAPTGSGKTEAAVIPIMHDIRVHNLNPVAALYVTPLRALNRDIEERLGRLAECFEITVNLWHGDTPQHARREIVLNPPHVLITTPESFTYILENRALRGKLVNLKYIVVDELHELMGSKRGFLLFLMIHLFESLVLNRRLHKVALTATLSRDEHARVMLGSSSTPLNTVVLRDGSVKNYRVDVVVASRNFLETQLIEKICSDKSLAYRLSFIVKSLLSNRAVLIFTNTRPLAEKLCFLLKNVVKQLGLGNVDVAVHHGSLSLSHRLMVEEKFKRNEIKGLIATSSMELGIDVGYVDYVIQYGSPKQAFRLLQRIGRSGHRIKSVSRGALLVRDNVFQIIESVVLTRRALSNDLEVEETYENPLDSLGYAIVAFSHIVPDGLDRYELYVALTENPMFSKLDYETYDELLNYLVEAGLVKKINDKIVGTRRGWIYIHKVNMIPETVDYDVVDVSSDKRIGVLNEEYVVLNMNEGDDLVLAGELWRVLSIDHVEKRVYVEKPSLTEAEVVVPHWEGESIPVDYRVAREVGSVIRRLKAGCDLKEYGEFSNALSEVKDRVQRLCDDRSITIAYYRSLDVFIIAVNGGDKVNRFLKDVLKTTLGFKYPNLNLKLYSHPYALFITSRRKLSEQQVEGIFSHIERVLMDMDRLIKDESFIKNVVYNSTLYLWRIYQVAQRFGAVDPEKQGVTASILRAFKDTVIGKEALHEVLHRDYDIGSVEELSKLIKKGLVKINRVILDEPDGFFREYVDYIEIPQLRDYSLLVKSSFRERILKRKVMLICLSCGWKISGTIGELISSFDLKCKSCGRRTLTLSKSLKGEDVEIIRKAINGERLSPEEKENLDELVGKSHVLSAHGSLGLIILGARGVGVKDVSHVVRRVNYGEDLYDVLYEYEKKVVKYKKYFR